MGDFFMKRALTGVDLTPFSAFANVEAEAVRALERAAVVYTLKHREMLYRQGDIAHSLYFVQSGGLKLVEHTADGKQVTLKIFGAGDMFGLLAISGAFPQTSSAEAVDEAVVIGIGSPDIREVIRLYPLFGLRVIDLLVAHVHHAHGRIRTMMVERVEQRLARALLHYCDKFGLEKDGVISIDVTLSQQDLAQFCGTTVETINRTLKAWQEQGSLKLSRQHIDIIDRLTLQNIVDTHAVAMADDDPSPR